MKSLIPSDFSFLSSKSKVLSRNSASMQRHREVFPAESLYLLIKRILMECVPSNFSTVAEESLFPPGRSKVTEARSGLWRIPVILILSGFGAPIRRIISRVLLCLSMGNFPKGNERKKETTKLSLGHLTLVI